MLRGRQADYWQSWAANHIPIQFHCRGEYLQWICHPSPSTSWVIQNALIIKPSFGGQANFSFLSAALPLHHCLLYSLLDDTNKVYFFQTFQFTDNIYCRAPQIPVIITQLRESNQRGRELERKGEEDLDKYDHSSLKLALSLQPETCCEMAMQSQKVQCSSTTYWKSRWLKGLSKQWERRK